MKRVFLNSLTGTRNALAVLFVTALASVASAQISVVFDGTGIEDNDIGVVTLDFTVGSGGTVALDSSVDNWDSADVGTVSSTLDGTVFSLTIDSPQRLQLTDNGAPSGGFGVQGRNQWRIDDSGNEEVTVELTGDIDLSLDSVLFDNVGTSTFLSPNMRIFDTDTAITYVIANDTAVDVSSDGYALSDGENFTFSAHGNGDGDFEGVLDGNFGLTNETWTAGGSLAGLTFSIEPPPALEVVIDRADGNLTLSNNSGTSFDIFGMSILSEAGSLVEANWNSIYGTYDAGAEDGGDMSVDPDDEWIEFNRDANDLSEGTIGTATIVDTQTIDFGDVFAIGGTEDVVVQYIDANSEEIVDIIPTYIGVTPTGLDGDFNDDGIVDAADYAVWRNNLGAPDDSSLNDNGDGVAGVTAADYEVWRANYGATSGSGAAGTIPEPSALALLALGFAPALVRSRKRG